MKATITDAGYTHQGLLSPGVHRLLNLETGDIEIWYANKGHASYGIRWGNTDLEFGYTLGHSVNR